MIEANDLEGLIATLEGAIPPGADIGEMVFHTSPELTLLYGRIRRRFQSGIHNHTVFACIAQLVGEEVNTIYERDPEAAGLQLVEQARVRAGEVIDLPADVIHSIENPGQQGGSALHLDGGDFKALMGHPSAASGPPVSTSSSRSRSRRSGRELGARHADGRQPDRAGGARHGGPRRGARSPRR